MFRFENMAAFTYLLTLPLILIMAVSVKRSIEKRLKKEIHQRPLKFLTHSVSHRKRRFKFLLELSVIVFVILAYARPQSGQSSEKVKSAGVELMIALDVSNSMMAEDIKPSRLEHAKNEINALLDRLSGDKAGLIVFAGSAVLLSPMTNDYSTLRLFLEGVGPDSVSTQGTNYEEAIRTALGAFDRGGVDVDEGQKVTRVLLIATDGEETTAGDKETIQKATEQGLRIFTMGYGTAAGAPIPERDRSGNLLGYKKDRAGQVVLSKTNDDALRSLAQAGKGAFYHADFSGQAVLNIKRDIDRMEKTEFESDVIRNFDERYQPLLLAAILLALLELLLGERKPPARVWKGRFEVTS